MEKYITIMAVDAEFKYSDPSGINALRLPGYKVIDSNGTEKWVPKDEFEKTFRPIEDFVI